METGVSDGHQSLKAGALRCGGFGIFFAHAGRRDYRPLPGFVLQDRSVPDAGDVFGGGLCWFLPIGYHLARLPEGKLKRMRTLPALGAIQRTNIIVACMASLALLEFRSSASAISCLLGASVVIANLFLL